MASGDTLAVFTPECQVPLITGTLMSFNLRNGHLVLEAAAGAADGATFASVMPYNYTAAVGITARVTWASKTVTTGTMGWDVTFERDSGTSGDDIAADHWATAQAIIAITVPGTSGLMAISSIAITAGATGTASTVAGDAYRVRLRRLSTDTAAGVAQVLSLELRET